jgi:uncharacterized small protein (DUF1192 family)
MVVRWTIIACLPLVPADNRKGLVYRLSMPTVDEDAPKKKPAHEVGEDLSKLSLYELAERIETLKTEILRIEEAIAAKRASADRAATFFKR